MELITLEFFIPAIFPAIYMPDKKFTTQLSWSLIKDKLNKLIDMAKYYKFVSVD